MNGSDVITAVVRGVAPYAVLGGAAYVGYRVLKKRGIFDDLGRIGDTVFKAPQKIVKTISEAITTAPNPSDIPGWDDNPILPPTKSTEVKEDGAIFIERDQTPIAEAYSIAYDGAASNIDRTVNAVDNLKKGNYVEAAQDLARNVPLIYGAEKLAQKLGIL